MYESHFGFSGSPFQLNPDPAFYFDSRGHSNALAYLKFGAHQGEGFIVVTGEIGAGKTTLVRTLLEGLNPDQVVAAQVVSTQLESSELLQAILMAFGVPSNSTSKAHLIASLEGFLTALAAKGRRALLIIDEAQNLRHEAVEELRMLSNFQLGKYGLLQSFLVGQPELRSLLQSKSMEQLRQRVIASCHLGPLAQAETHAYVEHRLRRVGWKGVSPGFTSGVFDRVHHWTGGVPRRINRLCNRLLLGAFLANASTISESMVDETALELKNEIGEASPAPAVPQVTDVPAAPASPLPAPVVRNEPAHSTPRVDAAVTGSNTADLQTDAPLEQIQPKADLPPKGKPPNAVPGPTPRSDLPTQADARSGAEPIESVPLASHTPEPSPSEIVRHVHQAGDLDEPFVCLVDSAADYLKAGVLASVFQSFPSLPRVVAVHMGLASDLGIEDLDALRMPLPAMGLHLGIPTDAFAPRTSKIVNAFDRLLTEIQPSAVLVMGNSDADLACSLLTRKRGLRLLRAGAGRRGAYAGSSGENNAVLIEKMSDVLYTDSTESFYALYREGIHLDRVHSVGSLSREMLDLALSTWHDAAAQSSPAPSADPAQRAGVYGVLSVDLRTGFARPRDVAKAVELFCDLSQEMPLVWLLSPEALRYVKTSIHGELLNASRVVLQQNTSVRQAFNLVRAAKCLISQDDGPWLEEARSLGIAALILTNEASLEPCDAKAHSSSIDGSADSSGARFKSLLGAASPMAQVPEYWDAGTATRIAGQLIAWFSKSSTAATTKSSPAHTLAVQ